MIEYALQWTEIFISIAVALQAIEFLQMKRVWSDTGVWNSSTLNREFSNSIIRFLISESMFTWLQFARLISCLIISIWPQSNALHFEIMTFLLISTWICSIRWRGLFNGGSDSMTLLILLSLTLARLTDMVWVQKIALAYITIQFCLSYLVGSGVKLISPEWISGKALPLALRNPRFESAPESLKRWFQNPARSRWVSISVVLVQGLIPLGLFHPALAKIAIGFSLTFHLVNFWIFGFNRFVFAWMAAYPSFLYWSHTLIVGSGYIPY